MLYALKIQSTDLPLLQFRLKLLLCIQRVLLKITFKHLFGIDPLTAASVKLWTGFFQVAQRVLVVTNEVRKHYMHTQVGLISNYTACTTMYYYMIPLINSGRCLQPRWYSFKVSVQFHRWLGNTGSHARCFGILSRKIMHVRVFHLIEKCRILAMGIVACGHLLSISSLVI